MAVLTRAADDCVALARAARAAGAEAVVLPCIEVEPLALGAAHVAAFGQLAASAAVAFASRAGVRCLATLLRKAGAELPHRLPLYAVGPATAAAVTACFGRQVSALPATYDAPGLAALLLQRLGPVSRQVLLPAAREGRTELFDALRAAGHRPQRLVVYETLAARPRTPRMTWDARLHYIVCASPSGVAGFFAQAELPRRVRFVCIGPTTSAAVRARGQAVFAEAAPHDARGLLAALTTSLELP